MKARVKHNNEIIDVIQVGTRTHLFDLNNVEFIDAPEDYWTRLEHTYAGMAMQGILACEEFKITPRGGFSFAGEVALQAYELAHALVEKMKEERK